MLLFFTNLLWYR